MLQEPSTLQARRQGEFRLPFWYQTVSEARRPTPMSGLMEEGFSSI